MASKKILIVDDDEELCEELKDILVDEGYSVRSVNDGLNARKLIEKGSYDIVLLDLKMPQQDGYHVLEYIKDKFPDINVIVFTGSPISAQIVQEEEPIINRDNDSILALADAVINKPCSIRIVIEKINELAELK